MALTINNSIASINARRQLQKHTLNLGKSFARLASGMRINTSQDDAAGLAISNRMVAQIRGMNTAIRNANDGISLAQVAEGALDETTNALQRMRELAIQAANSTYGTADRTNLNNEVQEMLSEVNRIATTTEFNNVLLLSGGYTAQKFHIGADANQTIAFGISGATTTSLVYFSAGTNVGGSLGQIAVTTATAANSALIIIDAALDQVSSTRASLGAVQSRFETVIASLSNVVENTDSARSRIQDADIAVETANLTKNTILQQAGIAILSQANQQPTIALALLSGR